MERTSERIGAALLSGLALLALLIAALNSASHRRVAVAAEPVTDGLVSQSGTYTLHLPLVVQWYDPSYISPFGAVMHPDVDDATELQVMEAAGSRWVRMRLSWAAVEPSKGSHSWASFDTKVQNAQAAGMDVFVLFADNPSWAALLPGGEVYHIEDLVNISTQMTERYDCDGVGDAPGSPCVHYWSFYGEPDNGDYGRAVAGKGYWGHDGAGYADMLYRVSRAIHAANPRAKVLLGGLAYDWFEEEGGPFVRAFLGDTLGALNTYPGGAKAYIDAVAFHFYPIAAHRWPTIREKALEVRGIMSQHGVGDLPLLCPEMGYWSTGTSSEQEQARRLVQMYTRSLSVGMRPMAWYTMADSPNVASGLLREDLSLKPAYYAYRTLAREFERVYYLRPFQHAGIEGYVFQVGSNREMTVLWAQASATNVAFPYSCLRRVFLLGTSQNINDGNPSYDLDSVVNGQITISIVPDQPIYIEPCH